MPKFPEKEIASVSDLLTLMKSEITSNDTVWFRGHDDIKWKLEPSIARQRYTDPFETGVQLYKRFVQNANRLLPIVPRHEYEWLFLMQHYGLPTHLLDWSESPLVGLYFAVQDSKKHNKDGALYFLDPVEFNNKASHRLIGKKDIFSFGIDVEASQYLLTTINAGNRQTKSPPMAIIGSRNSERIQSQEGSFVAFHRDMKWMESEFGNSSWGWKHKIPRASKPTLLKELRLLMMDYFTVYPQLDNLAKRIKDSVS